MTAAIFNRMTGSSGRRELAPAGHLLSIDNTKISNSLCEQVHTELWPTLKHFSSLFGFFPLFLTFCEQFRNTIPKLSGYLVIQEKTIVNPTVLKSFKIHQLKD